ncbi:copper homeostasis protein CutC [Flavobacterium hydatis]|uniref:PF03932 family protein CutC n=1 Tax=Flavobacterium hydatis TaxID=991 RepID=A0A086AND1_FLAHY|nr:copper homeostasis protein CutC [Flavobacterium hydatis]KFF18195.1 copper homeostasis protein [Flavobacterium hydatis]OXA97058.1 copper homeostasis protein CutC [Flavobacterium hydatis]
MEKSQLEIACFNLDSVEIAQANGANRIELCVNMKEGGTTPSLDLVQAAREKATIDLNVIIRPRGGDFVYTDTEFEEMKENIIEYKKCNVDGFVLGNLNPDGSVNIEQNTELINLANPLPCTFHRAFDVVSDVSKSLEDVINCGFKTILTSGQGKDVVEGIDVLIDVVQKANNRIVIMPGGGLRSTNIGLLKEKLGNTFFHSSAITDSGETASAAEINALKAKL